MLAAAASWKANLSNASLFGPVVSSGLDTSPAEAPVFRSANFSGARVIARLSRFDLRGANFTDAKMGADMKNQSMGLMRTDLSGADLTGANFTNADLGRALMRFAKLSGADLSGASRSFGSRSDRGRPDRRRFDRGRSRRRGLGECSRPRYGERSETAEEAVTFTLSLLVRRARVRPVEHRGPG